MTADVDQETLPDQDRRLRRRVGLGLLIGLILCCGLILWAESQRWQQLEGGAVDWLFDMNVDSSPFAILFLLLPLFWLLRSPILAHSPAWLRAIEGWLAEGPIDFSAGEDRRSRWSRRFRTLIGVLIVAAVSAAACLRVASTEINGTEKTFAELPPGFHDEFSYLFQAETYLAGRFSFPSHPDVPRLFDQMHVLNEGRFASRYFPGTGAWFAPFLAAGNVYAGAWAATVLTCVFVFLCGRELACNGVGLIAGLLVALSPGIDLFGNTLLAHQPTLVGLGLFLWQFLKLLRRLRTTQPIAVVVPAVLAGAGLGFAALCRPMTAAGFALPCGLWVVVWGVRQLRTQLQIVLTVAVSMAVPLMIAFGLLGAANLAITGSVTKTPYQLYTELFTPRHMFGFHNVERAQPLLTDRVLENYDRWAQNLDANLAATNVWHRLLASWQWTLSIVALVLSLMIFLASGRRLLDARWWLVPAGILSLHAVHIPYWYDGILHWHYVFESGVLWCLLAAAATLLIVRYSRIAERRWLAVWWILLLATSITLNQIAVPPFWGASRLTVGINQFAFPRSRYEFFRQLLARRVTERPALVFVRHDPDDRHLDYVSNHPSLTADILIGRLPMDRQTSEEDTVKAARRAFRDRAIYLFDAKSGRLALLYRPPSRENGQAS
ncbi:hypothetical protein GC176_05995 [bacterium]|nr:hypothetical protein [bacterium]